ncbi:MAG: hypothetical protein RBU29_15090 [bacterium]|jgi:hypothetical protein|nr:hypothetical protein [bacterium]
MKAAKKTIPKSLVGIEFDLGRINVVHMVRNGVGVKLKKQSSTVLNLDPLRNDPELVGQQIWNMLTELGVRESACIFCIPTKWILTAQIDLPPMPEEDEAEYVRLMAEREFPFPVDDLSLSLSRFQPDANTTCATQAAIPTHYLRNLEQIAKAARLRLVGITIATPANPRSTIRTTSRIVLQQRENGLDLLVWQKEGLAAIRWLETEFGNEPDMEKVSLVRELRITLGQLHDQVRAEIETIELWGSPAWIQQIQAVIQEIVFALQVQVVAGAIDSGIVVQTTEPLRPACVPLAETLYPILLDRPPVFQFLPPRITPLQQWIERVSTRGYFVFGGVAGAVLLLFLAAVVFQHFKLSRLESQWNAIADRVAEVESLQQQVKFFRPWYTHDGSTLEALHALTLAFPEEGTVWAKMIEFDENSVVSCTVFSKDNREWLDMIDRLRSVEQVTDLQVQQIQGKDPMQFVFRFDWMEG